MTELDGKRVYNLTGKNLAGQVGNIVINFVYFDLISNRKTSTRPEPEFPLPKRPSLSHIKRNNLPLGLDSAKTLDYEPPRPSDSRFILHGSSIDQRPPSRPGVVGQVVEMNPNISI